MIINSYLNFNGQCREAFELYKKAFGGDITMMSTYAGSPMAEQVPAEQRDWIMHGRLVAGNQVLMGSDTTDTSPKTKGMSVSVTVPEFADAERIYTVLSEGGAIEMPLMETFWSKGFAMFRDRFGTPWMINCEPGS